MIFVIHISCLKSYIGLLFKFRDADFFLLASRCLFYTSANDSISYVSELCACTQKEEMTE